MTQPTALFQQKVEELFFAQAAILFPGKKIYTPNARWVDPGNDQYFAVHVINGSSFNMNIGEQKWERQAFVLHVAVYTPFETYDRLATEMAESMGRVFANSDMKIGPQHRAVFRSASTSSSNEPKTNKFRVLCKVMGHRDFLASEGVTVR